MNQSIPEVHNNPFILLLAMTFTAIVAAATTYFLSNFFSPSGTSSQPIPTPVAQSCGGFAGIKCPSGYSCKITDSYPDAMGTCQ